MSLLAGEKPIQIQIEYGAKPQSYTLRIDGGEPLPVSGRLTAQGHQLEAMIGDHSFRCSAIRIKDSVHVFHEGSHTTLDLPVPSYSATTLDKGSLLAPMPGKVVKVFVQPGQPVNKGDALLVMEAMKMEHTIRASGDGVISSVHYEVGQLVDLKAVLVTIKDNNTK